MSVQGQLLEVTVVECRKLKDTEWISRQDPYVVLEYGSTKFRTATCKDGHKSPKFQEKFTFSLIEGLKEINVLVWNSNTLTYDDLIGSGKIQIQDVLSRGYDDKFWPLQTKTGRYAGEIKLIMHYSNANKPAASNAPTAPPYTSGHTPPYTSCHTPPYTSGHTPPYTSGHTPPYTSGHTPPYTSGHAPHISMYTAPPPTAPPSSCAPVNISQSAPYLSAYPASSPYPSYTSTPPTHQPPYPYPPPHTHDHGSAYAPAPYPPTSNYPPGPPPAAYPPSYPPGNSTYPPSYPPGPPHSTYPPPYH